MGDSVRVGSLESLTHRRADNAIFEQGARLREAATNRGPRDAGPPFDPDPEESVDDSILQSLGG